MSGIPPLAALPAVSSSTISTTHLMKDVKRPIDVYAPRSRGLVSYITKHRLRWYKVSLIDQWFPVIHEEMLARLGMKSTDVWAIEQLDQLFVCFQENHRLAAFDLATADKDIPMIYYWHGTKPKSVVKPSSPSSTQSEPQGQPQSLTYQNVGASSEDKADTPELETAQMYAMSNYVGKATNEVHQGRDPNYIELRGGRRCPQKESREVCRVAARYPLRFAIKLAQITKFKMG